MINHQYPATLTSQMLSRPSSSTKVCQGWISLQSRDCAYVPGPVLVYSWQGLSILAEPIRVMAKASESSDPLPSFLLQRIGSDNEMVNTGWIVKSTYFLIPQCGSRTSTGLPRHCVSSDSGWDDTCDKVLLASVRLSCGQL